MQKMLASLALFLAVFLVQTHAQTHKAHQATKGDNPSPPVAPIIQQNTDRPALQPEQQKHVQADVWVIHPAEKDNWDKATFAVSVLLLGVGIFGVIYAKGTLDKLAHHATQFEKLATSAADNATAAKDSAAYLLLNAQALINSERPWILMTSARIPKSDFCAVTAKNYGRTLGQIVRYSSPKWEVTQTGYSYGSKKTPNHEPILTFDDPILVIPESDGSYILLVSEETIRQHCDSPEIFESVKNGGRDLYIYGTIFYKDLLDPDPDSIHETAWCCRYISYAGEGNFLSMIGLPGYSYQT